MLPVPFTLAPTRFVVVFTGRDDNNQPVLISSPDKLPEGYFNSIMDAAVRFPDITGQLNVMSLITVSGTATLIMVGLGQDWRDLSSLYYRHIGQYLGALLIQKHLSVTHTCLVLDPGQLRGTCLMQLIMGCMETVATMARWRNTPFAPQVLVTCPEVVDDQTARDMAWIHSSWLTWAQRSERLAETWRKTSQTIRHPRKAAGRLGDRLLAAIERNSGWAIDVAPFYRD